MPFASVAKDTTSTFVLAHYLPPNFVIRDPRNLRKEEIQTLLTHILGRQRIKADDAFRFNMFETIRDTHFAAVYPGGAETGTRHVRKERRPRRGKVRAMPIGTGGNDGRSSHSAGQQIAIGNGVCDDGPENHGHGTAGWDGQADFEELSQGDEDVVKDSGMADMEEGDEESGGIEEMDVVWEGGGGHGGIESPEPTGARQPSIHRSAFASGVPDGPYGKATHHHTQNTQVESFTIVDQSTANSLIAHGISLGNPVNGPNDGDPKYLVPISVLSSLPTGTQVPNTEQSSETVPIDPLLLLMTHNTHIDGNSGPIHRHLRTADQLAEEEAQLLTRQLGSRRQPKPNSRYYS